jgi:hypothetical protein
MDLESTIFSNLLQQTPAHLLAEYRLAKNLGKNFLAD